jgi:hypothetical protein
MVHTGFLGGEAGAIRQEAASLRIAAAVIQSFRLTTWDFVLPDL